MRPKLRRKSAFDLVYTRGRKLTAPSFVLFHLESAADERVAFVASRKVGGAVQRNRAKRVLRAALAAAATSDCSWRGWLVLVARRDILRRKSHEVAEELGRLLGGQGGLAAARTTARAQSNGGRP